MISMDKTYKRADGFEAIVKFTDGPSSCPVGVITLGTLLAYNLDGTLRYGDTDIDKVMRLVEVSPYADFVIDEKVMVRDLDACEWQAGHFAGIAVDGRATKWVNGRTKWSAGGASNGWFQCRRPTAKELAA